MPEMSPAGFLIFNAESVVKVIQTSHQITSKSLLVTVHDTSNEIP